MVVVVLTGAHGQTRQLSEAQISLSDSEDRASPNVVNFQGYLTDSIGTPLTDDLSMYFSLFDAEDAGTWLWGETQVVGVQGGVFNVLLGAVNPIPESLFVSGEDRWLQVAIEGQMLSPRTRIGAVGFALNATSDGDWTITGDDMYSNVSGHIGVGTTTPTRDLHIRRSTGPAQIGIVTEDSTSKAQIIFGDVAGNQWTISSDNTDDNNLHFRSGHASGTPRVTLQKDGNVGIGTTNPTYYKLQVIATGDLTAVYGEDDETGNYAYLGDDLYAVAAQSFSGYAGIFNGDVLVTGDINKSACSFLIDHPLDPENRLLRHMCVESPEYLLMYRGKVQLDARGEAVVEMPEYFQALAREEDATVSLTPVGRPFLAGYDWLSGSGSFRVYGDPDREVSWVVYADRDDPVIREIGKPVEEWKGPDSKICDRGELLRPTAYGYPESMGKDLRK
jgi:hypothetical protein